MIWSPFKIFSRSFLGVDIGTSTIKIVELSSRGKRKKLENYGEIKAEVLFEKPFRTFEKSTLLVSSHDVARAILAVLKETKIKTKQTCFSIPDFSSFFTWFDLPPMTREELPQAVRFEARQHVPLPLGEVTLDWQLIQGSVSDKTGTPLKILLVAVPNEIIYQYQEIARLSNLKLWALDAEAFGLARALVKETSLSYILVDIGAQTTSLSTLDRGILKMSHSFDISGNELTQRIAKSLSIDYKIAENLKTKQGLITGKTREILLPLIDLILDEIKKISQNFYKREVREIQTVILAGGSALMPGLKDYFTQKLEKRVEIGNPFSDIFYPPILEKTLKEMGPAYAIAVGTALRGLYKI